MEPLDRSYNVRDLLLVELFDVESYGDHPNFTLFPTLHFTTGDASVELYRRFVRCSLHSIQIVTYFRHIHLFIAICKEQCRECRIRGAGAVAK